MRIPLASLKYFRSWSGSRYRLYNLRQKTWKRKELYKRYICYAHHLVYTPCFSLLLASQLAHHLGLLRFRGLDADVRRVLQLELLFPRPERMYFVFSDASRPPDWSKGTRNLSSKKNGTPTQTDVGKRPQYTSQDDLIARPSAWLITFWRP